MQPTNDLIPPRKYPIAIPTAVPATFFNAAAGTGRANFRVTPTVAIPVPANTHAGVYTATITIAIVAGP
jgi:hypothetical protein